MEETLVPMCHGLLNRQILCDEVSVEVVLARPNEHHYTHATDVKNITCPACKIKAREILARLDAAKKISEVQDG